MITNNVNFNYLEELSGGNKAFEAEILGIYISEVNNDISDIENAQSGGDLKSIAKIAHKLKSSIPIVGLDNLRETLTSVEHGLNAGDTLEQHQNNLKQIIDELRQSILAVEERLGH